MKKTLFVFLFLCIWLSDSPAQGETHATVYRIDEPIQLDGVLDEGAWQRATDPADSFWQYFPTDSVYAEFQTEIYFLYDEKNLYVAVKCYSLGQNYIIPSLKRDFRAGGNDNVTLMFDAFNDGTNAFMFGMNPFGVRREALVSGGGNSNFGFNTGWDNKWDGESKIYEDYWISEMAIPFKTLRFNSGAEKWRFNCYRFDTQSNETSTWARIPRNQSIFGLAFMGDLKWENPLEKSGTNIAVIPYTSGSWTEQNDEGKISTTRNFGIGGDAKIAVSSSLNLDLTFNPDFSQVEVDQQVTNLSRFEVFFPERRQFFTENADLFGGFGKSRINPFFSRRVGIVQDTATETNIPNPILVGARLSGKLNDNWRLGILNMTTQSDRENGLPTFNHSVVALQRSIAARSNIGFIFVNKEALNPEEEDLFDPYNRVVGVDYNLATVDNRWVGKTFLHRAFTAENLKEKWAHGAEVTYKERKFALKWEHNYVGDNFDAQLGFVPRKKFFVIEPGVEVFFYPSKGILNTHNLDLRSAVFFQPGYGKTDHEISLNWRGELSTKGRIGGGIEYQYTYLFEDFDPTRSDAEPLPAGFGYHYTSFRLSYRSDSRKKFSLSLDPTIGQFYNGFRTGVRGRLTYRFQPYGTVALSYNYNYIKLPEPYASTSLFLIGPRIDLTFSKKLFLTTFLQYNSQIENFNINTRLQWRFKPVSDFFLVYTNNYNTDGFTSENRALIAKVTYWLNL